jgi:hypothetical protein
VNLRHLSFLLLAPIVLGHEKVGAQARSDSAATIAISDIRLSGLYGRSVALLRAATPEARSAVREGLADSLQAIASSADTSAIGVRASTAALLALAHSGRSDGPGRPYVGAARRLFEVASSTASLHAGGAMSALTSVADRREAVRFLVQIAEQDARQALTSVEILDSRLGVDGRAALRDLYRRDSARRPAARAYLERRAREEGWTR